MSPPMTGTFQVQVVSIKNGDNSREIQGQLLRLRRSTSMSESTAKPMTN